MTRRSQELLEQAICQLDAVDHRLLCAIVKVPAGAAIDYAVALGAQRAQGFGSRFARLIALGFVEPATESEVQPRRYAPTRDGKAAKVLVAQRWLLRTQAARDHVRLGLPADGRRAA